MPSTAGSGPRKGPDRGDRDDDADVFRSKCAVNAARVLGMASPVVAGFVGESFGGKAIGIRVDRGDPPAVAVADLVDPATGAAGTHVDGDVVASAHDDVADTDLLIPRTGDGGPAVSSTNVLAPASA
jgi:hypothetical protein